MFVCFLFVEDFKDFCVLYVVTFAVVNGLKQGPVLVPGPGHTILEAFH